MNKKLLLIFIFSAGLLSQLYGTDTISSKIIIYRETNFMAAAMSFKVYINKDMVVKLRNGSYYEYICKPGEYYVYLRENPTRPLRIMVEEGKSYYVRIGMIMTIWRYLPEIILVDSSYALSVITNSGMRKLNDSSEPLVKPANRIGLNFNFGVGIEQIPMVLTTNNEPANISAGGGIAFGLKFGHEFGRYFDLSADLNYQISMLTPSLSNASVDFSRASVFLTPSLIIPLDGGDYMRLKLGGGMNYNWASKMDIDTGELPDGFTETWKYSNAPGFHASLVYELNYSLKWSTLIGIRYISTHYKFISGLNHKPQIFDPLYSPNGSAIDFLFGFYYHF